MLKFPRILLTLHFAFCILHFAFSQGTWNKKALPTNQTLWNVVFTDSLYGWVAGDSGVILHTTDGGNSWVFQNTQTNNEITSIFFLDRNRGWASAINFATAPYGTELLKTTNGGAFWVKYPYTQDDIFINCIFYQNELTGWMGGNPHAIVKTTDGGLTWTQASVDTSTLAFFPVLSIQFYNDQYGYASGGIFDVAGVIWRTWNGGDKWYAIDVSDAPADEVRAMHMYDSLHVMGAGGDPDFGYGVGMTRTYDGGLNWTYDELIYQGYATDIDFRTAKEAWAPLGPQRKMIYSLDSGNTWLPMSCPDDSEIFKICFPDSLHGFAVGRSGAFLVYSKPVIPSAETGVSSGLSSWQLQQNSPNPVSRTTVFRFRIPENHNKNKGITADNEQSFRIGIHDSFGRLVYLSGPTDGEPGWHEMSADLSALENGVYWYRLYCSGKPVMGAGVRRMMVAR